VKERKEKKRKKARTGRKLRGFSQGRHASVAMSHWDHCWLLGKFKAVLKVSL
jgi:hypothetical protein